jgi:Ni/Co efflux regulator RcnB
MRKFVLAFAALAAFGFILPVAAPAKAEEATLVVRTGDQDRDHDRSWHRDRHHHQKVVIIKNHRDHDHDHDND